MKPLGVKEQQRQKMETHRGFIAALDQSGGSTPNALRLYGIKDGAWSSEDEMFAIVHQMRTRIMTSSSFTGERILAAILFENTMDGDIERRSTADYLWNVKRIVPLLKVDKGVAAEKDGVQLMKPMPELAALLDKAKAKGIFGTKMRSLIKQASAAGIKATVSQQFEVAGQIITAGLVPIIEPEVDIHCPERARAEEFLKAGILEKLDELPAGRLVMLKLTLPEQDDFYADCVRHPNVLRVVALSGGYARQEANDRLRRNHGVVASFSRALVEGLSAHGYRSENGVASNSQVETFVALQLEIDSWRWRGVPFYIRAGKSLPVTCTEVLVQLRQPPTMYQGLDLKPNYCRFRISPDVTLAFGVSVLAPAEDTGEAVELLASHHPGADEMGAYERVLGDAMAGDASLFAREDNVEEAWRIVDPVLKAGTPIYDYEPNSWGPREVDQRVSPVGGWHNPTLAN